jgi:hypothetical protein
MPDSGESVQTSRRSEARTLRNIWHLIACALVAGCATPPPGADDRIYRGISRDEIQEQMQHMGLRAERQSDSGISWLESGTSGYEFHVYFYDCDVIGVCEDVQLRALFVNKRPLALEDINRWNTTRRFAKAYLLQDGDLAIEMDLPAKGGITSGEIRYVLEIWDAMLNHFADYTLSDASVEDAPEASP